MIAALAIVAQAVTAGFAPPLNMPIRVITTAERTDDGITRRFVSAKRVVFRRDGAGFLAEVTVEPGTSTGSDEDSAATFAGGMARLAGRTLVFRLDAQGRVVGMIDQAAAWAVLLDGFAALSPPGAGSEDRARAGRMQAVRKLLAALPPERQLVTLGSMVVPLIATDIVMEGEGPPRAVRVPAASAFGTAQLDGLRAVRRAGEELEVSVSATGSLSVKGPAVTSTGLITLETSRRVDPRTGLLISSQDTVRTTLPDGSLASDRSTQTQIQY